MRKIKIDKLQNPRPGSFLANAKYYSIALGNKKVLYFKSERTALRGLGIINEELNNVYIQLNSISISAYTEYRYNHAYLDQVTINKVIQNLKGFDSSYCLAADRSAFNNGNHFVFSHLQGCIACLVDMCNLIEFAAQKLNHYATVYRCQAIKLLCGKLVDELNNIGLKSGAAFVKGAQDEIAANNR